MCGWALLSGCRSGVSAARRDKTSPRQAVASKDRDESDQSAVAPTSDQRTTDRDSIAQSESVVPKSRKLIPDWLRFGNHESVPLSPSQDPESEPDVTASTGADFQ